MAVRNNRRNAVVKLRALLAAGAIALAGSATTAKADPVGFGTSVLCYSLETMPVWEQGAYGVWVLGYWRGVNAAEGTGSGLETTGYDLTGEQIDSAVDGQCRAHPSWTLQKAVMRVYDNAATNRDL